FYIEGEQIHLAKRRLNAQKEQLKIDQEFHFTEEISRSLHFFLRSLRFVLSLLRSSSAATRPIAPSNKIGFVANTIPGM
ncbi:MAG TPA: hypothetical protein PLJ47_12720, partial [Candidatus Hydrogenedentes bacterium]|nr:hypothetical protein [Candidatus Hydrogenedentota bacterium]